MCCSVQTLTLLRVRGGCLKLPAVPETSASFAMGLTLVEPEPRRAKRWASRGGGRGGQAEGPERGSNAVGQAGSPRREAVGIPSRSACWRGRGAPAETVRGVEGLRAGHPTLEPHTTRQQFVSRMHSRFGGEGHPPARGPPCGCEAEQREPAGPPRPARPTPDAKRHLALAGGRDWLR